MTVVVIGPVVSPDDLVDHVGDPSFTLIEVSFYRPDRAAYGAGHIPGSRYVYWKDLLWDDVRREFPPPLVLAGRLGELGVGDDSTLVLVGDPVQFATYAYWVLVLRGLATRATVLDGGHATWARRGYPLTNDVPVASARARSRPAFRSGPRESCASGATRCALVSDARDAWCSICVRVRSTSASVLLR